MIEIQEEKINKDASSLPQIIDDAWKKYNKRMDDMIEDAEIEAEMEAEKKIRSKNSKLFTTSIIGIALLGLIFIKVQQHSNVPQAKTGKKTSVEEATFLPRKTQLVNPQAGQLASAMTALVPKSNKAPAKSKNVGSRINRSSTPKNIKTEKTSKPVSVEQTINGSDGKHYIQLGAFSIKKNAEKFADKIKSKGFNTVIPVHDTKSTRYHVFIGSFNDKNNSKTKQADLKASGFTSSLKRVNNTYTLDIGAFRNIMGSNSLVKKLRDKGFTPKIKKVLVVSKTYMVRVEGLETKNEAQKTRQKLADQGFINSFIR